MPIFLYVDPRDNKIVEEVFPCRKAPASIALPDGTVCERSLAAEIASQGGANPACWPMYSQALAVHPSQRKEFGEFADKHGVTTEFDTRGRPKFESKSHRKKYCELVGATDFDGGYGDPRCD